MIVLWLINKDTYGLVGQCSLGKLGSEQVPEYNMDWIMECIPEYSREWIIIYILRDEHNVSLDTCLYL
jgi:hypothetical protein